MKTLILSILLTGTLVIPQNFKSVETATVQLAALPDYNSWRLRKVQSFFEMKTTPKLFVLKVA